MKNWFSIGIIFLFFFISKNGFTQEVKPKNAMELKLSGRVQLQHFYNDAFRTGRIRPLPRCAATVLGVRNVLSRPPTRSPKMIYTEASCSTSHELSIIFPPMSSIFSIFIPVYAPGQEQ